VARTGLSSLRSCGVDHAWSLTSAHSTGLPKFFWYDAQQGWQAAGSALDLVQLVCSGVCKRAAVACALRSHGVRLGTDLEVVCENALRLLELRSGE